MRQAALPLFYVNVTLTAPWVTAPSSCSARFARVTNEAWAWIDSE